MTVIINSMAPGGSLVLGDRLSPVQVHLAGCSDAPSNVNPGYGQFAVICRLAMSAGGDAAQRMIDAGSGGSRVASGAGAVIVHGRNDGIISTGTGATITQRQGAARTTAPEPERGSIAVMPERSTPITSTQAAVTMHHCTNGHVAHAPVRSTN